jgi:putative phage-type endonuclease
MQQRTEAWRQWRAEGIGASLAPGVMGVNPWFPRTPYEVFLLLTKRVEAPPETAAMRRGLALEAAARRAFETQTGLIVEPATREHSEHPFLRASLDGITLDGTEIVELKVPGRETFEAIRAVREVPPHYYWQVQQQLAVSGAARCHLWLYGQDEDGVLLPVLPNQDDIARLVTAAKALWSCVQTDTAPPHTDRDTVVRTDPEWLRAAAEYRHAEHVVTEWTPVLDRARRTLIALMQGAAHVEGAGIVATRFARQGTVDYKAIVHARLPDVDMAAYRRPGGEQVRITVSAPSTVAGPDPGSDTACG